MMAGTYFTHSICDEVSQLANTSDILKAKSYMLLRSHDYQAGDCTNLEVVGTPQVTCSCRFFDDCM
jgi:hypothetical protein